MYNTMYKKFLFLSFILVLSLVSISYGTDPCFIKVDINYHTDNNDANTQAGYAKFSDVNSGQDVNGVIIDLSGNFQDARRAEPCGPWLGSPPTYWPLAGEKLYRDFIAGLVGNGITITLWGLGADRQCDVNIFAFDAKSIEGDFNRVANWYANGTYIFDTNFKGGGSTVWPRYEALWPQDIYMYCFGGTTTTDKLGRIVLTSSRDPCSPAAQPFSFVNGFIVNPKGTYVPTGYAHRPVPFSGTTTVPVSTDLKWRNGGSVVTHDLYFGDDFKDVNDASRIIHNQPGLLIYEQDLAVNTNQLGYDPYGATGFLKLDTTYYWRIDEQRPSDVCKGDVWNFTTLPYAYVDNFNSYAPPQDELEAVWNDGWYNGTRAVLYTNIGDPNRDGNSMQYTFSNTQSPYYSEAEATLGTGAGYLNIDPNWIEMEGESLTLWFYGKVGNDANKPMYVKLTDSDAHTATVYYSTYGDMNDIKVPSWHEWNIDFADFTGVNMAKVSKILIGFGDKAAAATNGVVYFDNIMVYTTRCSLQERSNGFAKLDYAPAGSPAGDCVIDYREIDVIADTWLDTDQLIKWKKPDETNLIVYYSLNEGDGNKVYSRPDSTHPDVCDARMTGTFWNSGLTPPSNAGLDWGTPGWNGDGNCVYVSGIAGSRVSCGTPYGQLNLGAGTAGIGLHPERGDVNAITLSAWVKWLGPRTWSSYLMSKSQGILGKRGGWDDDTLTWMLEMTAGQNGAFALRHYAAGSSGRRTVPDLYTDGVLNPFIGFWAHVAATYPNPSINTPADQNAYARTYLNGGYVNEGPWRFSYGYDANIFLTIGCTMDQNHWVDSPESFYGYIDEVRIYNRALEPNEIAYLADITPEDGNTWVPIASSAEVYSVEEQGKKAINFKDFALVVKRWLNEEMFPPTHRR